MDIEVFEERHGEVLVLVPVGRLDSDRAHAFESLVMDRIRMRECHLVVDFGRLEFISSSGLRVLPLAAKALKAANRSLVLCSMKEHIALVFQISGFSQVDSGEAVPGSGRRRCILCRNQPARVVRPVCPARAHTSPYRGVTHRSA